MRYLIALLAAPLVVGLVAAAPAHAIDVHYGAYAAGVNVIDLDIRLDLAPDRYRVKAEYQTVGAFGALFSYRQESSAEGRFRGARPTPDRFYTGGTWRGEGRVVQLDYVGGQPTVRQMIPPAEEDREPVPPEKQRDTIDSLSAMVELIRQVSTTGRCDGRELVFDGRRLGALEVRTSGQQMLEPTGRSSFSGMALRCDFVGRQTGGFMLGVDRATLERPQTGTAWFAPLEPGGPALPVRVAFRTRWLGDATLYLTSK